MSAPDRAVPIARHADGVERRLLLDEMEETARAIRKGRGGFRDVAPDEARGLEAAIDRLRDEICVRGSRDFGGAFD